MTQIIYKHKLELTPNLNTKIYRLAPIRASERKLINIARKYKLSGDNRKAEIVKTVDAIYYTESNFEVSINKFSGATRFIDMQKWQYDDGKSNITFKENEANSIADNFIQSHKLAKKSEYQPYKVTKLEVGSLDSETNKANTRVIDFGVVFQRVIGGIPVEGPGGKIIVYIDAKKEVTGCDMLWREIDNTYRSVSAQQLKSPLSFERSLSYISRKLRMPKVVVDEMRFGYFEDDFSHRQLFMQPVYIAPFTVTSEDGRFITKSFHIFNASMKPVGKIKYPSLRLDREPKRT